MRDWIDRHIYKHLTYKCHLLRSYFIRIPLNVSYSPCFHILCHTKNISVHSNPISEFTHSPNSNRRRLKKNGPIDGWFVKARLELFRCLLLQGFLPSNRALVAKVPSKMMPTEKTPKLQLNRKTAWEVYILSTSGRCFDMNTSSSTALPAFWGKDLPSFSKVFPRRIRTRFSDFVVLWDIWRPLLFCHFLQSRIGLGFFLRIQQIFGLAGSMPQGTVGGFGGGLVGWGGGYPLNQPTYPLNQPTCQSSKG